MPQILPAWLIKGQAHRGIAKRRLNETVFALLIIGHHLEAHNLTQLYPLNALIRYLCEDICALAKIREMVTGDRCESLLQERHTCRQ